MKIAKQKSNEIRCLGQNTGGFNIEWS